MLHLPSRWLLPAAALVLSTASLAGPEPALVVKADPLDVQAPVPAVVFESAFTRYRAQPEQKLRSWRDANDEVSRIGGWRTYAREAAADAAPAPAPAEPPRAKPMPQGSGAHQNH